MVFSSCETEEPIPTYTLSTTISPTEGGKITVSPQSPNYKEGDVVTLTPEPNEHWVFQKWDGDGSGSTTPLQITMNSNKSVVGVFVKRDYPLLLTIEGEGTVEEKIITNPSGREYPHGTTVELTPKPKEGWVFDSWGGDLTGSEIPKRITVDKEKKVTAKFKRRDYPLNLTIEGEGTVEEKIVSNPNGREYPFQTIVELTPKPKEGWVFESWGGDLSGTETPKTITVDKEKNVTVKFKRRDYPLNITIEGEGTVEEKIITNPGGRSYPFETVVELKPVPKEGWVFESWSGDLTGSESPKNITVDKERNVTVKFKERNKFYLYENGVTCLCPDTKPGDKGVINGIEFESVDNYLLYKRRDEGVDMTKLCTSLVTNMSFLFRNRNFNQSIGNWDVSNVTNMEFMFENSQFNQPIGNWDVGNVTNMISMFSKTPFNQSIGNWNVSKVTNMRSMFNETPFNQPTEDWDVSNVTDMSSMFRLSQFNQPINNWKVSNVTKMNSMFSRGNNMNSTFSRGNFNQPIGNWDVSNVTDMSVMFWNSPFNQPLGNWDVGSVTNMDGMFSGTPFNQPLGNWDVSNVTAMGSVFSGTPFNQPIGDWDVSKVTDMGGMFSSSQFNQPIENWNVSNVTSMSFMFSQNSKFNQPIGNWNVSKVTKMERMFSNSQFNQPIGNWDVSNVTNMKQMFENSQFNQPIENWNVGNVTNMFQMFVNSKFNQPIGNWNVNKVTQMVEMFLNTPFNQDISKWCVTNITNAPKDFSLNSPLTSENKPKWGTCPN
jgi:uncharacterized repeat protein (TIGR02543 family)